jgi:hypothetical protein
VRHEVIGAQSRRLAELYAQGRVGEATHRRIQRELDLEAARLTEGP